jgi:hypothetical protein
MKAVVDRAGVRNHRPRDRVVIALDAVVRTLLPVPPLRGAVTEAVR